MTSISLQPLGEDLVTIPYMKAIFVPFHLMYGSLVLQQVTEWETKMLKYVGQPQSNSSKNRKQRTLRERCENRCWLSSQTDNMTLWQYFEMLRGLPMSWCQLFVWMLNFKFHYWYPDKDIVWVLGKQFQLRRWDNGIDSMPMKLWQTWHPENTLSECLSVK